MKVSTFTAAILQKMIGIKKCQAAFISHIVILFLSMRSRKNFLMMGRYSNLSEQTYRNNFKKDFDFKAANSILIKEHCGSDLAFIFDPSYIKKSGKKTPGTGYFWSGCANSVKWGMEISSLAVADMENHTAMHYHAQQTQYIKTKDEDTLRTYYSKLIAAQAPDMLKISNVIILDAFFSKQGFVDSMCELGFCMVSRLQSNIYLKYAYTGERKKKPGRPKIYDGQVDLKNLREDHFTVLKKTDDEIAYQGVVHVRALGRWCSVVIVHIMKGEKVHKALVYFSTDKDMAGEKVYQYYKMRYQIEFLFRDTKNHLGLEDSQSRQTKALDFHFNMALTTLNIAKAMHWYSIPKEKRTTFSIQNIKTQYINQFILDRLILIYGKDPNLEINNPNIRELYDLGRITA